MAEFSDLQSYKRLVGQRLRAARLSQGLKLEQVANRLAEAFGDSVQPSRIGNYEQGTRFPDPLTIRALCRIYDCFPSQIYGLDEAPNNEREAALVSRYRQTDERGRRAIEGIAESQPVYDHAKGQ